MCNVHKFFLQVFTAAVIAIGWRCAVYGTNSAAQKEVTRCIECSSVYTFLVPVCTFDSTTWFSNHIMHIRIVYMCKKKT